MTAQLADYQVSSLSKQSIAVPISETISGGDPTGFPVELSFPSPGQEPSTWVTGSWQTGGGIYYAEALVGPGSDAVLAVGYYDVYVKITASPEVPVLRAGLLEVI